MPLWKDWTDNKFWEEEEYSQKKSKWKLRLKDLALSIAKLRPVREACRRPHISWGMPVVRGGHKICAQTFSWVFSPLPRGLSIYEVIAAEMLKLEMSALLQVIKQSHCMKYFLTSYLPPPPSLLLLCEEASWISGINFVIIIMVWYQSLKDLFIYPK